MIDKENQAKLDALQNKHIEKLVLEYAELCQPSKITVITGSPADLDYVKKQSLLHGEEASLGVAGHTYHFDGMADQGRDKAVTKVLLSGEEKLSKVINTGQRDECLFHAGFDVLEK